MASCKNVADLFGAYIYGDLPPDEMKKLRLHIDECEECARELEIQSRVISMIPSEVPALSDEERQRIEWTVKGAIRAKEKPVRIGLFSPAFIKGFAFTTAVVAAFAAGTAIGLRSKPVKENTIVKTAPAEHAEKKPAISQPPDSVAEQPKETIPTDSVIPVRQELAV
ncbi:MAG TPA: zf-HC2 domain-containing protein, partial [Armatimonadota bacterium]|nr:zf-HC2 domain-containing protein [Armatimonadota bacterium]